MRTMLQYTSAMLIVISIWEVSGKFDANDEGPFELIVHNTTDCLVKEHSWFKTNITAFASKGHTLLRGTVVSTRPINTAKFRIACHYAENGSLLKVFEIKNQNCRNIIVKLVLASAGLPFNDKKCSMKEVKTEFNNLDLNSISHYIAKNTMWYGNARIRWEVLVPNMKLMCLDINFTSARLSQKKL